jgi:acyl carrier protein
MVVAQAPQSLAMKRMPKQPLAPRPFTLRRCWLEAPNSVTPSQRTGDASLSSRLLDIIRSVTGYDTGDIGLDTPLNQYGLDSLMSMRMLASINTQFGSSLQLADLLVNLTVHSLVQLLRDTAQADTVLADLPLAPGQFFSEADCQDAGWLGQRLSSLTRQYRVVKRVCIPAGAASLPACLPVLERLTEQGIAVLHTGTSLFYWVQNS